MGNNRTGNFPVKAYRNLNLGVTGQIVKNSLGEIFNGSVYNNNAAVRYLKVYDKATAPDENDTPIATIPLAPNDTTYINGSETGVQFLNGISLRATTGIADADTGAPGANDVVVNLFYS